MPPLWLSICQYIPLCSHTLSEVQQWAPGGVGAVLSVGFFWWMVLVSTLLSGSSVDCWQGDHGSGSLDMSNYAVEFTGAADEAVVSYSHLPMISQNYAELFFLSL